MATTLFQARFDIQSVTDLGGSPKTWQVVGDVHDTGYGFTNANVAVGDVFYDESLFDRTVNRYVVTTVVGTSGAFQVTVNCQYDEPGTPGGLFPYPVASSGIICTVTDDYDLAQRASTGWAQVTETIKNAVLNEDMRRVDRAIDEVGGKEATVITATTYNVQEGDQVLLGNTTNNNVTMVLPPASGQEERTIYFKKTDSSDNALIVDADGTETIDGELTQTLGAQYESITIVCDGTEWWII